MMKTANTQNDEHFTPAGLVWKFAQLRVLLERDAPFAVPLLQAIYGRALEDQTTLENAVIWLEHKSTVTLRDDLAALFQNDSAVLELAKDHFYPFNDCWMSIDSAMCRLSNCDKCVFWIARRVEDGQTTWQFWDSTYSTAYHEGTYDSLEKGMIAHGPAVFYLIDDPTQDESHAGIQVS